MATNVYNTKHQALDSKKLAELFSFSTNDFAGLISNIEEPIVVDTENSTWSWNASLLNTQLGFVGGGVDIEYDVEDFARGFTSECSIWGLEVGIPDPDANITTNSYNKAKITEVACEAIARDFIYIIVNYPSGDPSAKGYYEFTGEDYVITEDTEVNREKVYYVKLDEAYKVTRAVFEDTDQQAKSFDYFGNTVWITDSRFFIPFCGISEGEVIPMLFNRDMTGYESFLTARTYYHLLQELGNKFVWRVGGETLGDIGDLNVTDNYITNKTNAADGVKIDNPVITNIVPTDNVENLLLINADGKVYKTSDQYIIPVNHGGTNGDDEGAARTNLGFTYGTATPSAAPKKRVDGTTDIGAVYFKLL